MVSRCVLSGVGFLVGWLQLRMSWQASLGTQTQPSHTVVQDAVFDSKSFSVTKRLSCACASVLRGLVRDPTTAMEMPALDTKQSLQGQGFDGSLKLAAVRDLPTTPVLQHRLRKADGSPLSSRLLETNFQGEPCAGDLLPALALSGMGLGWLLRKQNLTMRCLNPCYKEVCDKPSRP